MENKLPRKNPDGSVTVRWGGIDATGVAWDGARIFRPGEPGFEAALADVERDAQYEREREQRRQIELQDALDDAEFEDDEPDGDDARNEELGHGSKDEPRR